MATVLYIRKENCLYQACPSADCNKKVIDQQNGLYRCEKCNREFPNFKYRFLLSVSAKCIQCTSLMLVGHTCLTLRNIATSVITHTHMNNLSPLHHLCPSDSQANLADFGDNQWVTCFQETAEVLLGHSAETLGQLRDTVRDTHTDILPNTVLLRLVCSHLTIKFLIQFFQEV